MLSTKNISICSNSGAFEDAKSRSHRNREQRIKMHCFKERTVITREGKKEEGQGEDRKGGEPGREEERRRRAQDPSGAG